MSLFFARVLNESLTTSRQKESFIEYKMMD